MDIEHLQLKLLELQRLDFELELLKSPYYYRVMRWPGALAMAIGISCNLIVRLAGAPPWLQYLAGFCAGFAAMTWLARRAWPAAQRRKWNSLEA